MFFLGELKSIVTQLFQESEPLPERQNIRSGNSSYFKFIKIIFTSSLFYCLEQSCLPNEMDKNDSQLQDLNDTVILPTSEIEVISGKVSII